MKKILIIFFSIFFLTEAYSANFNKTYTDIPISKDVDLKTASPWNFHDDFESGNLNFNLNCGFSKKRTNNDPLYEFKKEENGNTYIAVTAKHKQCAETFTERSEIVTTERSEITTNNRNAREKIVWFGMRMRIPKDFEYIDDRTLLWQFKHMVVGGSPLIAFRLYDKSKINIGGQYGGKPNMKWKDKRKYYLGCKYKKSTNERKYGKRWCERGDESLLDENQKFDKNFKSFDFAKDEWITFRVGTYTTKSDNGFIKVYLDRHLVFDYEGPTYEYSGGDFIASAVRFGIYRDAHPENSEDFIGYPDQTVHYDDFVVTSDKETLDNILNFSNIDCIEKIKEQCLVTKCDTANVVKGKCFSYIDKQCVDSKEAEILQKCY
jgi:hypothetical protein